MSIGRCALAGVIAGTFATAACTAVSGADLVTLEPAAPPAAVRSAPAAGLLLRVDGGSSSLGMAVDEAIEEARRERDRAAAAAKRSGGDCAQQAMDAGRFDPTCPAYQGYLDPGTSAGRAPTSGEVQMQFACQQGLVPESDC